MTPWPCPCKHCAQHNSTVNFYRKVESLVAAASSTFADRFLVKIVVVAIVLVSVLRGISLHRKLLRTTILLAHSMHCIMRCIKTQRNSLVQSRREWRVKRVFSLYQQHPNYTKSNRRIQNNCEISVCNVQYAAQEFNVVCWVVQHFCHSLWFVCFEFSFRFFLFSLPLTPPVSSQLLNLLLVLFHHFSHDLILLGPVSGVGPPAECIMPLYLLTKAAHWARGRTREHTFFFNANLNSFLALHANETQSDGDGHCPECNQLTFY